MEENSFETLNYLTPGDQDPFQNEEEDFEETKRESDVPGNKIGDFVNGYKEERRENIDPKDSFPNVMSVVELDNTSNNHLPREGDDLFLSLPSMPNGSSVTCPTVTQNLSCVTSNDCSGMKVKKHIGSRHTMTLNIQNLFAETPCLFMQKKEMVDKSFPNEPVLCHQHGSRTSDKFLREEQGVYATKNNYQAFFTTSFSGEELQLDFNRQPCFDTWPEGPHKFICEQRPKKDRSHKQACPDSRGQLTKSIFTFGGASGPESSPEILIEEKRLIENEDLSPPTETLDSFIERETNIFRSCLPQLDIPKSALELTKNKKKRQKRILNLVPNFNLLGQSHINAKERKKHGLLAGSHELKIILGEEKDRISEINNKEDNKQKLMTLNHHPSWFYLDIIKDPPLNIGGQFYFHCLSFNKLRHFAYFCKDSVPSVVLHYISSFWKVSFTSKKPFLTFKSHTRVGSKLKGVGIISTDILSSQPDTLCSLRVTSDLYFLNERFGEKLKRWEEPKPLQCLSAEDNQDLTSTGINSFGLPLSQGFVFQQVKLFGSPEVPVGKLFSFAKSKMSS